MYDDTGIWMTGNHLLCLEHYKTILAYHSDYIRIHTACCDILIRGRNLELFSYDREEARIRGMIETLEFTGTGKTLESGSNQQRSSCGQG